MDNDNAPRLILASGSLARRTMLKSAGVDFDVVPADIDEAAITAGMISESDCVEAADIASTLAFEKAAVVARAHPGSYVIGSDQTLAVGRHMITKATSRSEARDILDRLRGRSHEVVSAVAIVRNDDIIWQSVDAAQLTMRRFSDSFLDQYLDQIGDAALSSVGCYHVEGVGAQLFERIEGDHFTILGMPLISLLEQLRRHGVLQT